jgi:hypothetical protein
MGFWGGLPVAGPGLRVPQDSQVARRGRGIHHKVQRLQVAERPTSVYEPDCASLAKENYPVLPGYWDLVGNYLVPH